jgi:hypothetical protein
VIASPSPDPPNRRVVDASAWENGLNSLVRCSGVIPIPVSATRNTTHPPSRAASSRTRPPSVNLHPLDSRLNRLCRTLVGSARMAPRSSGQDTSSSLAFFWASGSMVVTTSRTIAGRSNVSG